MKTLLLLTVVATGLAWSSSAQAFGGESTSEEEAEATEATEAFKTGQTLFDKGEYLEAAEAFKRAYHLRPHPAVLANVGYCYRRAGDTPRAVEVFRRYIKHPHAKEQKKNAEIRAYLKKTKSKVGDLNLNCHPRRCEVKVDDVSRGMAPATLVLTAGVHTVDVVAVDENDVRKYEVVIPPGGKLELAVDLTNPMGPGDADHKQHENPVRLRAPFWIAAAAAVAGAGSVAVLGVLSNQAEDDFKNGGSTDVGLKERGENLTLGANIAIGLTAASTVTAIILAIVDLKRKPAKGVSRLETSRASKFGVDIFNGGSFVGISGAF